MSTTGAEHSELDQETMKRRREADEQLSAAKKRLREQEEIRDENPSPENELLVLRRREEVLQAKVEELTVDARSNPSDANLLDVATATYDLEVNEKQKATPKIERQKEEAREERDRARNDGKNDREEEWNKRYEELSDSLNATNA